jgi:GTPase SAR1 family protein
MGKTGAGKSTIINAILGEDLAPTGSGQPVTKVNQVYSKDVLLQLERNGAEPERYGMVGKHLNLYDTVGLEIDTTITNKTLSDTKKYLEKACTTENDITLVWFCVNCRSNRFEQYEINLLKELSIDYEIPFVVVITQCYTDEQNELETLIKEHFPGMAVARILAKDYKTRGGCVKAHGLMELLQKSVGDYDKLKVSILEEKLDVLSQERANIIQRLNDQGESCVKKYSDKAMKIGFVPGGCIPFVHGICIKIIMELNKIVGITGAEDFATEIFENAVVGIIVTPFMAIPLLSGFVASAYVETVGDGYMETMRHVIETSTVSELKDNELMSKRIKEEIRKRKK